MNIKTSAQSVFNAFNMIKNIGESAYVGSNGLFDTGTLLAYKTQLEGLTVVQAKAALSSAGLTKEQQKQVLAYMASSNASKELTSQQILERLSTEMNSDADARALLNKSGLIAANEIEEGTTITLTQAKIDEIFANELLSAEEKKLILSTFGETGAKAGLTAVTWELVKAQLAQIASNPTTWILAAVAAIAVAIAAYIKWGDTLDNTREKLADLKSECDTITSNIESVNNELETTKQRIDELEGKDKLTFTEKEELDNLVKQNNELQRTIDLLKLEQNEKNKEKNKTFVEAMKKDVEQYDEYHTSTYSGKIEKGHGGRDIGTSTDERAYINQQLIDYQNNLDEIAKLNEQYKDDLSNKQYQKDKKRLEEQNKKIYKYLTDKNKEFTTDSDGISYILNPTTEDDKAVNAWLDYIADFQDRMSIAMGGDNAKTNTFNRVVDNWQFDDTVQGLQDLGKEGKVTAEMLDDPKYDDFINKLVFLGFIDSADNLEDVALAFNSVADSAENAADSASKYGNEIDVSLDSYKKASEGVSSLATAFKELTDSEYVSLDTISKIKEAVGDSVSNWDAYEQKLLSVKKGTEEYNQLMRELTYATLEKQLGGVNALANADEKYVAQLLKENGVLNANEVAHSAVERAKAKELAQSNACNQETVKTIESLTQEANSAGISTNAYLELTAKEILFNNNTLDTSQKCQQILAIASAAGVASTAYSTLSSQIEAWSSKDLLGSGTRTDTATKAGITVISNKNRTDANKTSKNGNLYIASDGTEFEKYTDAMYYQESLNNVQKISDAYSNVNFTLPDYSGVTSGGSSKDTKETFDWIETAVSRLQRSITNFGKTVSATWKSWTDRNSALKSQISAVTNEINLQQQAADKYWALAEGVSGVGNYKGLIQKGALDISTVRDENTIGAIKQYQEYYEAYLSALDAKQDAQDELANLVREDFDMIAKQFDSEISLVEANISTLEAYIDQTEMKGNLISKNYYSAMYAEEEKNLGYLQQKYEQLSNALSSGGIASGTEEWNSMSVEIKEVKQSIIESTTALEEYQKTMHELDWEVFDLIQDKIGNVVNESNDWIDLLSNYKLFNDDGSITSQGQTTLGLHLANLKIYESQVKDYGDELSKLDEEFANDPLDQNYLARRQELVQLQREAILNCEDEKSAIKDLYSEGFDNLLSYMDKLISKRKELLNSQKD